MQYKLKFILNNTIKQWATILGAWFTIIGILATMIQVIQMFYENFAKGYGLNVLIIFFVITLLIAFVFKLEKIEYSEKIRDTDITVRFTVDNVLKQKGIIVIPTTTTFSTGSGFVGLRCIQGQFQKMYFENSLEDLDKKIQEALSRKNIKPEFLEEWPDIKFNKRYPIGTTCVIRNEKSNTAFCFVAMNDTNEDGAAILTDKQAIDVILNSIWKTVYQLGDDRMNINIPLLGSDTSGEKLTRNNSTKLIIKSFIDYSIKNKISDELRICITERDLSKQNFDYIDQRQYLKFLTNYYDK